MLLISENHPKADLDHHKAKPWQQRPHLESAYVELLEVSSALISSYRLSAALVVALLGSHYGLLSLIGSHSSPYGTLSLTVSP